MSEEQTTLQPSLTGVDSAPTIFADGIAQVALGYPMSRVIFHTVSGVQALAEGMSEQRKAEATIVMPTANLIEAMKLVLDLARQNEDALATLHDAGAVRVREMLQQMNAAADKRA